MTTLLGTHRILRENTGASVDVAIVLNQRGTDSPTTEVPDGMTKITEVRLSVAPDFGTVTDLAVITDVGMSAGEVFLEDDQLALRITAGFEFDFSGDGDEVPTRLLLVMDR